MKKPILVIMAAGMGSRYGGLKQIDPVDGQGHIIMDFSIYDARRAGFEKVVFIIKEENEKEFREAIGSRAEQYMETSYAFQRISDIPEGFSVPEGRAKPWGTAHAVLSAIGEIDGPFAVINADDYYGKDAFQKIYDYLSSHADDGDGQRACGTRDLPGQQCRGTRSRCRENQNRKKRRRHCLYGGRRTDLGADPGKNTGIHEYVGIYQKHPGGDPGRLSGLSGEGVKRESAEMRIFSSKCSQRTAGARQGICCSAFVCG